ncbi:MAG: hypothetical protein WBN41_04570 [Lysobacterales bacterium]
MSESQASSPVKAPWHLWVVGIVGTLWSAMGAMDYVMTKLKVESYMAAFTPEQLEFFYGFPIWVNAAWAIAVWGGVIGCIILLMRKSVAVEVLLVSFIAMVITAIHNYGLSNGLEVVGDTFSLVFTAIIFIVSLGLYLYAKAMRARGVLK